MDRYLGKRLDKRYEIQEVLGVGGMSTVYKAYDQTSEKMVAIKILKEEFLTNQDFIRRFKNESKAISVLSHPNIVKINNVSFGDKIQYIVMEYIDGITLKEYIKQNKKLSWQEGCKVTKSILNAISHAHQNGIVHRDIKPQNIIISNNKTIKVTDFGIARFTDQKNKTMTEKTIGSVHYISPEQAKAGPVDAKSDIYSAGVILYEMVTGELPFQADTPVSVALMQVQNDPVSPKEISSDIPSGLDQIILKAMRKSPRKRFSSAKEMLSDIEKVEKNPEISLNYNFFDDQGNTKYMDAVPSGAQDYGDNYIYSNDQTSKKELYKNKKIKTIVAGAACFIIFLLGIGTWALLGGASSSEKEISVPDFVGQKAQDVINSNKDFNFSLEQDFDLTKPEGVILEQEPKAGSKKVKKGAKITLKVNTKKGSVTVPNLVGLAEEAAKKKLKELGLGDEIMLMEDESVPKGSVIKTDPKEGLPVEAGSSVRLFISKGSAAKKVRVPNVVGLSKDSAIDILVTAKLKVSEKITVAESSKTKDTVISTSPSAGTEISEGAFIELTVSSGVKAEEEQTIFLSFQLPSTSSSRRDLDVKVYIDGALDSSNSKIVNPTHAGFDYKMTLKGTGVKKVVIDIDGTTYKTYQVDFKTRNIEAVDG